MLTFFRDKGLDVPNVALFLHLFNPTATTEGFIYFPRCPGGPPVISDLPSSHRQRQLMMPFSTETGLERMGSLGWDKTADGLN